ncbi:MAG: CheY-P-specific phosphatase CheC [Chloroflexi bacterium]|jgi:chemotaxis protein CheC|nr:CheY-P-specific phosphatase CheC [Chloroflexota bacterium]
MEGVQRSGVYEVELARWTELVGQGTHNAVLGLSEMVGVKIRVTALDLKEIPVRNAADLVGGAENEVVVIYLGIVGGATGHIMLVYPINVAFGLVDMLMGEEIGTTQELGEMEASALQEMGNITGSFFLNSVADNTGMQLMPTPPTVMIDMAGAIIDAALAEIMVERDELFAMETVFSTDIRDITGTLLVLPTAEFMDVMLEQNRKYARVQW